MAYLLITRDARKLSVDKAVKMVEDSRGHCIAKDNLIYDLYSKFNEKVPEDRADQIKTYEHEFDYQVGKNLQIIY